MSRGKRYAERGVRDLEEGYEGYDYPATGVTARVWGGPVGGKQSQTPRATTQISRWQSRMKAFRDFEHYNRITIPSLPSPQALTSPCSTKITLF